MKSLAAEYADLPSGLDGDDDCGQMSAWYLLHRAWLLPPVTPASGDYMLGSARSSAACPSGWATASSLRSPPRETRQPTSTSNPRSLETGKPLEAPVITYDEIVGGAKLELVMAPEALGLGGDVDTEAAQGPRHRSRA